MTTTATTSTERTVERYFEMWNEPDAARRRAVIAEAWAPDARYVDPLHSAAGADALDAMVAGLHETYPGHFFRLTEPVDAHNDRARWGWEFAAPDGTPVMLGVDFAVVDADGRLREVTGFFEQPAVAA